MKNAKPSLQRIRSGPSRQWYRHLRMEDILQLRPSNQTSLHYRSVRLRGSLDSSCWSHFQGSRAKHDWFGTVFLQNFAMVKRIWPTAVAGEADSVSSVSASACHSSGPKGVSPGQKALLHGTFYQKWIVLVSWVQVLCEVAATTQNSHSLPLQWRCNLRKVVMISDND